MSDVHEVPARQGRAVRIAAGDQGCLIDPGFRRKRRPAVRKPCSGGSKTGEVRHQLRRHHVGTKRIECDDQDTS